MQTMQCQKKFCFGDGSDKVKVVIPETVDPKYGMFTWPSAPVLAQFIWHNREQVKGKHALELGSGTSLCGIVAAFCGARVTLTDSEEYPECLKNCHRSCLANNLSSVNVIGLTWGQFSPAILKLSPLDLLLGSDCFYDPKDFDDILATVSYFMDKNKALKFWTSYQVRSTNWSIEWLLRKWGMNCVHVPLEMFGANDESLCGCTLGGSHTIQMLEITRKKS